MDFCAHALFNHLLFCLLAFVLLLAYFRLETVQNGGGGEDEVQNAERELRSALAALNRLLDLFQRGTTGGTGSATGSATGVESPNNSIKEAFATGPGAIEYDPSLAGLANDVLERLIITEAQNPEQWDELITPIERHLGSELAKLLKKTNKHLPTVNCSQEAKQAAQSFLVAAHRANLLDRAILEVKQGMEGLRSFLKSNVHQTKLKLSTMNWKGMTHAEAMRRSIQLQRKSETDASTLNSLAAAAVTKMSKVSKEANELRLAVAHPSIRKTLALSRPLDVIAKRLLAQTLKMKMSEWKIHDATQEGEAVRLYAKRYVSDAASWSTKNAQVIIEDKKYHARLGELLPGAAADTN